MRKLTEDRLSGKPTVERVAELGKTVVDGFRSLLRDTLAGLKVGVGGSLVDHIKISAGFDDHSNDSDRV